ncbi:MAG TPA: hypothetical protein VG916_12190, partial [Gemmatimonadaceae bacterium]|nr:hypothetical protein [Gemmatimonadaceae bacterium]
FATGRGCNIKEYADFNSRGPPAPLPPLSQLETVQAFQQAQGPTYDPSFLAMDQLTAGGGLATLKTYWTAIAATPDWPTAFQNAFGQSSAAFYAQFPGYVAGLSVPSSYACGGI